MKQHCVRRWVLFQICEIFFSCNARNNGQNTWILFLISLHKCTECSLQLVLNFHSSHVLLLQLTFVEFQNQTSLCNVSVDVSDIERRCDFECCSQFLCFITRILLVVLQMNNHCRCTWNLTSIDDLDDTWQTLCDVDRCNTSIVERTHGHLCTWFTNRLCGNDSGCFERIDARLVQCCKRVCNNGCCLLLGQLLNFTIMDCKRHIVNDFVAESVGFKIVNRCFKGLVDRIISKFIIKGAKFTINIVSIQICCCLSTRTCAGSNTTLEAYVGGWTCCFRTSSTVLLESPFDGISNSTCCFRIGFTDLSDILG